MTAKVLVLVALLALVAVVVPVSALTVGFTASPEYGDAPLFVSFMDQSSGVTKYRWDFGDGSPYETIIGGGGSTSHVYTQGGVFVATLTANDLYVRSKMITVTGPPPTTVPTTVPTTEIPTTVPTTVPTTEQTTIPTTEVPTEVTTVPTTEVPTTAPTTVPTTEQTTVPTTLPTTEVPTETTTQTTVPTTEATQEPSPTPYVALPPIKDRTIDILLPWMPAVNNQPIHLRFRIGDFIYIIRRG